MKKLLIATRNPGKFREISGFLKDEPVELVSLTDLNIENDIEEDGLTYEDNARKKAQFFSNLSGLLTLADDSGVEIDALGGQPGKNTRRWLGHEMTDDEIIEHLNHVSVMLPDDNRKAYFNSVVCLAIPSGELFISKGRVEGIIAKEPLIKKFPGFPFRSFFSIPQIGKFFFEDEFTDDEQKLYNHRYIAVEGIKPAIRKYV